ncbi:MAG: hypothetical protein P4L83_14095 [Nevskia sp.]|nr:hypothetical protein [Nevskia sp.]
MEDEIRGAPQPKDFAIKQGASAGALVRLAQGKGYRLVAATACNLLLLRQDLCPTVIGDVELSLETLRDDSDARTFVFFGYDGTVLTSRSPLRMPWHRLDLEPAHLQQLPRYLRRFPGDFSALQKALFVLFVMLKFPQSLSRIVSEGLNKLRP